MAPDRLSYHDVFLHPEDIALLKGSHWINDQIISFWFEYLNKEKYPYLSDSVALIGGATAFLLCQLDPAEAGAVLGPLNLSSKNFILAAVNDSESPEVAQAGQHWSLLAWDGAGQTFRHFDSHAPHNHRAARKLADALATMLGYKKTSFIEASSRQQDNGYDCGVCVMANADILCSNLLDATLEHPWEGLQEDARAFKNTRGEALQLVESLQRRAA